MDAHGKNACTRLAFKTDSAGAIVFQKGTEQRVLMLSHGDRGWVFPKKHLEDGESEMQAAVKETFNAAGINIEIIPGFRYEASSGLKKDSRKIFYYVARPINTELVIKDTDHSMPAWQPVSDVERLLRFKEDIEPFKSALEFFNYKASAKE